MAGRREGERCLSFIISVKQLVIYCFQFLNFLYLSNGRLPNRNVGAGEITSLSEKQYCKFMFDTILPLRNKW